MNSAQAEQITQVLWPATAASGGSVWAVLDAARDSRVYRALLESQLEFRCLYSGRLPRELDMAAPQLVELPAGHRLARRLLEEGWGRSWGVFLTVSDPSGLRHHLRTLLKVRDESGRQFLFRFYDPRVLRAYLPTCTPAELQRLFGPVDRLFAETPGGAGLIEYAVRRGALEATQRPLSLTLTPAPPSLSPLPAV